MLDKSNLKQLSQNIRSARQTKGLTQEQLANKLGVPLSRVIDWESYGKKNYQAPTTTMVRALNAALFDEKPQVQAQKPKGILGRIKNFFASL